MSSCLQQFQQDPLSTGSIPTQRRDPSSPNRLFSKGSVQTASDPHLRIFYDTASDPHLHIFYDCRPALVHSVYREGDSVET
jgi:hypothetical protein